MIICSNFLDTIDYASRRESTLNYRVGHVHILLVVPRVKAYKEYRTSRNFAAATTSVVACK